MRGRPTATRSPLEYPTSAESIRKATEVAEMLEQINKKRLPQDNKIHLPTIAEIAAMRCQTKKAKVHGEVLKSLYQNDFSGHVPNIHTLPRPACNHLVEVLRYLCSKSVGIYLSDYPGWRPEDGPRHWKDGTQALQQLMAFRLDEDCRKGIPHEEILGIYIEHHYISDDPQRRLVKPPGRNNNWRSHAFHCCTPDLVAAMLNAGETFECVPSTVDTHAAWVTSQQFIPWSERAALLEVNPDDDFPLYDFLLYFKVCCRHSQRGWWENSPAGIEVVKRLQANLMLNKIREACLASTSTSSAPPRLPKPRRASARSGI